MYGHRGASLYGSGGVSDVYEIGSKRPRMTDSNPYFAVSTTSSNYQPYNAHSSRYHPSGFPAVRLRGLPFNCAYVDIFKFFAGLDIVDVFLVHKNGRFSGEAFVVFSGPMQADIALQRDRQNIGRRYVEVFKCKKQDYYHAIASEVSEGSFGNFDHRGPSPPPQRRKRSSPDKDSLEYTEVLKMRGLPYSVKKSEIVKFFGDYDVTEDKIQIGCRSDGKATGEAYVEFETAEEAKEAMCKDKMMIGSRYVELFPSTPDEARRGGAQRSSRR